MNDTVVTTNTVIQTIEVSGETIVVPNETVQVVTAGTQGPAGQGLPAGGTTGQIPTKQSNDDYDIAWANLGGTVDHGDTIGLTDDDHPQYHNNTRGDARYYTQTALNGGQLDTRYYTESEINTLLLGKENTGVAAALITAHEAAGDPHPQYLTQTEADALYAALGHTHTASEVTDFQTSVSANVDVAASKAVTDFISVTQAVDLDTIEARVNDLDAAVVLRGSWDASSGSFPGAGSAQAGASYIVSVGGTVDSVEFSANDRIVAIIDNASTSTYANNWLKLDYTDEVLSVAGKTGAVTLVASDVNDFDTEVSNNTDVAANTSARHDAVTVSNTASVSLSLINQLLSATVLAGGVNHNALLNYVANEHIDWTNASQDLATTGFLQATSVRSGGSPISSTGFMRLANNELIGWRNSAGSGDVTIGLDSSNILNILGPTTVNVETTNAIIGDSTETISQTLYTANFVQITRYEAAAGALNTKSPGFYSLSTGGELTFKMTLFTDSGSVTTEDIFDARFNAGAISSLAIAKSGVTTTVRGALTVDETMTLDGAIAGTSFKDEDDMVSNSATSVASQQSIKTYVDNENTTQWRRESRTLMQPATIQAVRDKIWLFSVEAAEFPNGITIQRCKVNTPGDSSYSVTVIDMDDPGDALPATISTVATSASKEATTSPATDVAAGQGVGIDLPTTAVDFVTIEIWYSGKTA